MSETADKLMALVLETSQKIDALNKDMRDVGNELYQAYQNALSSDQRIKDIQASIVEWTKAYDSILPELFGCGTVVGSGNDFYVVDTDGEGVYSRGTLNAFKVTNPLSRRKRSTRIYITEGMKLVSLDEIEDRTLRANAEKLIARLRLKEW